MFTFMTYVLSALGGIAAIGLTQFALNRSRDQQEQQKAVGLLIESLVKLQGYVERANKNWDAHPNGEHQQVWRAELVKQVHDEASSAASRAICIIPQIASLTDRTSSIREKIYDVYNHTDDKRGENTIRSDLNKLICDARAKLEEKTQFKWLKD